MDIKNLTQKVQDLQLANSTLEKNHGIKFKNLKREFLKVTKDLENAKKFASSSHDQELPIRSDSYSENNDDAFSSNSAGSKPFTDSNSVQNERSEYDLIDKPLLIDKILRLQKLHHKKNDKIEVLLESQKEQSREMKKKSLVIQHLLNKMGNMRIFLELK